MKKENAYILAFDPSLTAWGWALIQLDKKVIRVVRVGCIRTSPGHKKKKIRKGAMMGVQSCWHPDIEEFIVSKQSEGRLSKFNISVVHRHCKDIRGL